MTYMYDLMQTIKCFKQEHWMHFRGHSKLSLCFIKMLSELFQRLSCCFTELFHLLRLGDRFQNLKSNSVRRLDNDDHFPPHRERAAQ